MSNADAKEMDKTDTFVSVSNVKGSFTTPSVIENIETAR